MGPACASARARGRANSSIQAMADHRIAELREREGHQVTLSRRRVLTRARATPCGFATARLTSTLPFPIKRPGGPVSTETLQHVALFEKCRTFLPKAREVQAAGLHAWYKPISRSEDTVVVIEGKERIMMGSNNYLGLTHHPDVLAAAKAALDRYGSGCTGSRLLNGTLDLHVQLEAELAEFFGKEACVVFSTGYQANLGVVSGLVGRGDLVFLDKLDHASIVDGAKLAFGDTQRFAHGDLAELERRLQKAPATVGKMIIVDGVYSMEGDIADAPALLKISQKHGAVLVIDDAHAVGVLGPKGDGTAAHFGIADEVELIVGTFSKSLASIGEFEKTLVFWRKLFDAGVFTNPVVPPALPPSRCRLRTSVMATHTDDQIDYALETFGRLGKELGVV